MKSKFNWIMTLLLFFVVQVGFAQTKTIKGVVKDVDGYPVAGASVTITGTDKGVETDEEGAYSLYVNTGDRLKVEMMGFVTQEVTVGKSNLLNVTLAYDFEGEDLGELVIDQYRTISKPKSTTSSSVVTSKTIEGRPNASFVQTLQGQVPGLNIATGSGQPGTANTSIILRGPGSINGNTEPLFVIDGVPMESSNFRSINQNDIENVTVLKDAGATSIYGNRGANGVIVVTTKGASFEQDLQVRYMGLTKVSSLQNHKYNLMNTAQLIELEKAAGIPWGDSKKKLAADMDWLGYFFTPAVSQNHTVSFSGGSKTLSSYTSVGFTDEEGILINSSLKRFNFRNNLNGSSNDGRLTYGTSLSANYSRSNVIASLGTGYVNDNVVVGALKGLPYMSPSLIKINGRQWTYDDFYNLATNPLVGGNALKLAPLLLVDKANNFTNLQEEVKIIANARVGYDLGKGFTTGTTFGVDYTDINSSVMEHPYAFNSWYYSDWKNQEFIGYATEGNSYVALLNSTTNLKWEKRFDKHELKVGAYLEYIKGHKKSSSLVQNGLHPAFATPGVGAGWIQFVNDQNAFYLPSIGLSNNEAGLFSYFGALDYDYDGKYGLGATIRRDASYRFAGSNRWGTFWSVSGRWNIDREDFMKNSGFNMLKLRGSYGTAGNQDILGTGMFGAASLFRDRYGLGGGYNNQISAGVIGIPNPNLSWETVTQANVGLDWSVWKSRFRGAVDYYVKTTSDLYQSRPISAVYGQFSINANVGEIKNEGVETQFALDVVKNKDWTVTFNMNGAYNKNTVVDLPSEDGTVWNGGNVTLVEGGPMYQYYLVEYYGVDSKTGNLLFKDKNGNITQSVNDNDRVLTGKNWLPTFNGGFGLDVEYKGFFLNTMFTFATDVWRFDFDYKGFLDPRDIGVFNKSNDLAGNYWTTTNRDASLPSLSAENLALDNISDRFLYDASYLRMRFITLGYNLSPKALKQLKMSGLRVYAQGENLMTWTKWKGFDAESNRAGDQNQYPTPKSISFGVEVSF